MDIEIRHICTASGFLAKIAPYRTFDLVYVIPECMLMHMNRSENMFLFCEFLVIVRNMELLLMKKTKIKEASRYDASLS